MEAAPESALKVYDINLRQHYYSKDIIESSLEIANVLKINDDELERLKPMFCLEGFDQDRACTFLLRRYGLRMLVLTAGDRFSSVFTDDGVSTIPTPKVKVVDAVGAGDSFSGALVGSLLNGLDVAEAHRVAVETAAYVCTQAGAWTPPGR